MQLLFKNEVLSVRQKGMAPKLSHSLRPSRIQLTSQSLSKVNVPCKCDKHR